MRLDDTFYSEVNEKKRKKDVIKNIVNTFLNSN